MGFLSNLAAKIRGPQVTTYKINGQNVSPYDYHRYEEVRQASFQKESLKQATVIGRQQARPYQGRQLPSHQVNSTGLGVGPALNQFASIIGQAARNKDQSDRKGTELDFGRQQPQSFNFGHNPYNQGKLKVLRRK